MSDHARHGVQGQSGKRVRSVRASDQLTRPRQRGLQTRGAPGSLRLMHSKKEIIDLKPQPSAMT